MTLKKHKISFCIVCMNRLHHLRQTLLTNMLDNEDYPELEFILVDYNSSDGLEDYVRNFLQEYIDKGTLVYYKTLTPSYFNRSHSRNLAFKLATGDLICNIDADNYTGKSFAAYLNDAFNKEENIFLTTVGQNFKKDVLGRICVKRADFYMIKGYDERMINYGFEDYDFVNRLEMAGVKRSFFENKDDFFKAITHEQTERLSNEFVSRNLYSVFMNYLTPSSTELLFLFNNKEFKKYLFIDHQTFTYPELPTEIEKIQMKYRFSFVDDSLIEGNWIENEEDIILSHKEELKLSFDQEKNCYSSPSGESLDFYKITDEDLTREAVMLYSQIVNRILMEKNKLTGNFIVNSTDFGKDTVYKNFTAQILTLN